MVSVEALAGQVCEAICLGFQSGSSRTWRCFSGGRLVVFQIFVLFEFFVVKQSVRALLQGWRAEGRVGLDHVDPLTYPELMVDLRSGQVVARETYQTGLSMAGCLCVGAAILGALVGCARGLQRNRFCWGVHRGGMKTGLTGAPKETERRTTTKDTKSTKEDGGMGGWDW